jgi:hypothetical protein
MVHFSAGLIIYFLLGLNVKNFQSLYFCDYITIICTLQAYLPGSEHMKLLVMVVCLKFY